MRTKYKKRSSSKTKRSVTIQLCIIGVMFLWLVVAFYLFWNATQPAYNLDVDQAKKNVIKKPLSPHAWLELSKSYDSANQTGQRNIALSNAVALSQNSHFYLERIFKKHLTYRRFNKAADVANRLSEIKPSLIYDLFKTLTPYTGVEGYLQRVLPGIDHDSIKPREFYLYGLLKMAISAGNAKDASRIWAGISPADKRALIENNNISNIAQSLRRLDGGYLAIRQIAAYSTKFILPIKHFPLEFLPSNESLPLCWHFKFHPTSDVDNSSVDLKLTTPPISDKKGHSMSCYIPISSAEEREISLQGNWSHATDDEKSAAAILVSVHNTDQSGKQQLKRKRIFKNGSWATSQFQIKFDINATTLGFYIDVSIPKSSHTDTRNNFSIGQLFLTTH